MVFWFVCGLPNLPSVYVRARQMSQYLRACLARARARGARVCQQNTVQQQQQQQQQHHQQQQQQHQHQQQQQQQQQQPPPPPPPTHTLFPGTAGGCVSSWISDSWGEKQRPEESTVSLNDDSCRETRLLRSQFDGVFRILQGITHQKCHTINLLEPAYTSYTWGLKTTLFKADFSETWRDFVSTIALGISNQVCSELYWEKDKHPEITWTCLL